MIPPGPRTVAQRERAAQLRAAWQSLRPDVQAMLKRMDAPARAAIMHKIVDTGTPSGEGSTTDAPPEGT